VGRVNGKLDPRLEETIKDRGLDLLGTISIDDNVYEMDLEGSSVFDLPQDSPALEQVRDMLKKTGVLG